MQPNPSRPTRSDPRTFPACSDWSRWIGIPWADRGRDRAGCDCYGLICLVYAEEFGVELPSYADDYVTAADVDAVAALLTAGREAWLRIPAGMERTADVALVWQGRVLGHAGIVARPGKLLHVKRGQASVIESYRRPGARFRVEGFYRHRG